MEVNCIRVHNSDGQPTNEQWFTPARDVQPETYMTDNIVVSDPVQEGPHTVLNLTAKEGDIHLMDILKLTYNDRGEQRIPQG